jgi:dTDP-4-dehydrorhamnose 3,5-epimerase
MANICCNFWRKGRGSQRHFMLLFALDRTGRLKMVTSTDIPEVLLIKPRIFSDNRGHFFESYHVGRYLENGIPARFVQDNISRSKRNVVRGLHYQIGRPQGKLVMVVEGRIFDVAVDLRRGSPTFGRWVGVELSSENCLQIYIPEGFAHGFCTLSETAAVLYKCTDYYAPGEERTIRWDDPALSISWPVFEPILSEKDRSALTLSSMSPKDLPLFRSAR